MTTEWLNFAKAVLKVLCPHRDMGKLDEQSIALSSCNQSGAMLEAVENREENTQA